jgi:hypothetical protein
MADFVYDVITLNGSKVDRAPIPIGEDPNKWIDATDWNPAIGALNDIRDAIINNRFLGLQRLLVQPNVPTGGAPDFMWLDNAGVPWLRIGGVSHNILSPSALPAQQIAFGNGTALVGSVDFLWDNTNKMLTLGGGATVRTTSATVPMQLRSDTTLDVITTNSFSANPPFSFFNGSKRLVDVNAGGGGVEVDFYDPRDGTTNTGGLISATTARVSEFIIFHDAITALSTAATPAAQSIFNIAINPGFAGATKHVFETWVATPGPTSGTALLAFSVTDGTTLLGTIGFTSLAAQLVAADGISMVQATNGEIIFNGNRAVTSGTGASAPSFTWQNNAKDVLQMWVGTFEPAYGNTGVEFDAVSPLDGTTALGGIKFTDKETLLWAPELGYVGQETFNTIPGGVSFPGNQNVLWLGRNQTGGVTSIWGRWWATTHAVEIDFFDPSGGVSDPHANITTSPGMYFGNDPGGDETDIWSAARGGTQSAIGLNSAGRVIFSLGSATTPIFINFTASGSIQVPAGQALDTSTAGVLSVGNGNATIVSVLGTTATTVGTQTAPADGVFNEILNVKSGTNHAMEIYSSWTSVPNPNGGWHEVVEFNFYGVHTATFLGGIDFEDTNTQYNNSNVFGFFLSSGSRVGTTSDYDLGLGGGVMHAYADPSFWAAQATAGAQLKNNILTLNARYWNGAASVDRAATFTHMMDSTTPTSHVELSVAGGLYLVSPVLADIGTPNVDSPPLVWRGTHFSEGGGLVDRDNYIKNVLTGSLGSQVLQFHVGAYDFYIGDPGTLYMPPDGAVDTSAAGGLFLGGTYANGVVFFAPPALGAQDNSVGATWTINPSSRGYVRQTLTSATNVTAVTVSTGAHDGQLLIVQIIQPAAGTAATVVSTWTNVRFAGGAGAFTATLGKHDTYTFVYNANTSLWSEVTRSLNETN